MSVKVTSNDMFQQIIIYNFLLVVHSSGRFIPYGFEDTTRHWSKLLIFQAQPIFNVPSMDDLMRLTPTIHYEKMMSEKLESQVLRKDYT